MIQYLSKNNESTTIAISNCLLSLIMKIPSEFQFGVY